MKKISWNLDELEMGKKDGLIVALGKEQCRETVLFLEKRLKDRDILLPDEWESVGYEKGENDKL